MKLDIMSFLVGIIVLMPSTPLSAQTREFRQRFEVNVPARGLFGAPPKRELVVEFDLPKAFQVLRVGGVNGATVADKNLGGLTEENQQIDPTANGIKLTWDLKNADAFPLSGRTAFLVLALTGKRISTMDLSDKYKSLRQRFVDRFYFQGRVAASLDQSIVGGKVTFADQTMYMGQALMVFATEMAILNDAGKDTTDTRKLVKELLDGIEDLERKANVRFGSAAGTMPDGLFVRDDITGPADPRLGGHFSQVQSDGENPSMENDSPSGDQIFGMMHGLYCVVRYTGDALLAAQAKAISARLFEYARRSNFILQLPNGQATRRGSDMRWLASLLNGLNKAVTGDDHFAASKITIAGTVHPLNGIAAFWGSSAATDVITNLAGKTFKLPLVTDMNPVEINSFALHILLMAIAPTEVWSQEALEPLGLKCNHHLAVLYNRQTHGSIPGGVSEQSVLDILDLCPTDGPRASLDATKGWREDNRWVRCTNIFDPGTGNEEYNGLDWMVLHNIEQLVYAGP
jgi:hypothetical protein